MRDSEAMPRANPRVPDRSMFTVLVVDDSDSARYAMARVLRAAGFKTMETASGAEALRLAAQASAVILDVHLPDVNGFEVCRLLRRSDATAEMPIIQVSAVYTEPNDSCAAQLAGADRHLVSPVPAADLVAAVDTLLANAGSAPVLAPVPAPRAADPGMAGLAEWILEQTTDALIYADREGLILRWNHAAAALFGFSSGEALGRSLDLIIPEHLRAPHWAGYRAAMASGSTRLAGRPSLTRAVRKDGAKLYVEMTFAVVKDDSGAVVGSVAIARDATERVQRGKGEAGVT